MPVVTKSRSSAQRIKKLQFVFVIFKHCETKSTLVDHLESKDPIQDGQRVIKSSRESSGRTVKVIDKFDDKKFLGNSIKLGTLFEPDEFNWHNLGFTKT